MSMTVIGIVAGLAAAFAASRVVSGLLFDVGVLDPAVFIGAPVLLLVVALLAAYLPHVERQTSIRWLRCTVSRG